MSLRTERRRRRNFLARHDAPLPLAELRIMSLTGKELEKGQAQLKRLCENHFFRNNQNRELPTFDASEIDIGPRLGVGGFGVVCEVQHIKLDVGGDGIEGGEAADGGVGGGENFDPPPRHASTAMTEHSTTSVTSEEVDTQHKLQSIRDRDADLLVIEMDVESLTELNVVDQHDHHYNLTPASARTFMAEHSLRDGDARYAIKRLKPDLNDKERLAGIKDLAIEAKFLAVVSHPNIIKMRGTASCDSLRYDYFIVMDRLYGTLDERIGGDWAEQEKHFAGCCGGMFGANKEELDSLRLERVTALYDVSKAMAYLHENNIIYRDIKPENLGFDVRGDVKLFDFGLSRVLQKKDKRKDGTYKLTGRTGSLRYMSPEVALNKPYNLTADVFSFATLMWQVLELQTPFESFTARDYVTQVCERGFRPTISSKWPVYLREVMKDSWKTDLSERPDFSRLSNVLRGEMRDMADAGRASIHQRTTHMMNRSNRSHRNLMRSLPKETEISAHRISISSSEGGGVGGNDDNKEAVVEQE